MTNLCPLCQSDDSLLFCRDSRREYRRCEICQLVFVPAAFFLSAEEEKAEYDLHENAVDDAGYRRFLSRLAEPLMARLSPAASGLDFGCGPGPALAALMREAGFNVALYDIFYCANSDVLNRHYDFITATEVVEHLHQPGQVIRQLWSCLYPGGQLAMMTKLVHSAEAFSRWHYKNDPTHVVFFSRETFAWLAATLGARLEFFGDDVIFLAKPC